MKSSFLAAATCLVFIASPNATAQSRLFRLEGASLMEYLGNPVVSAGDANGDGVPDIAVAAIGFGGQVGMVQVVSGVDGSGIHYLFGASGQDQFGRGLAGGEDLNGDGFDDIVVAAPRDIGGRAEVYSGADGTLMYTLDEPASHPVSFFASAVSVGGDVDGDGLPDLLASGLMLCEIYSGVDGSLIHSIPQPSSDALGFGMAASFVGDVNGDGLADVAIGAHSDESSGIRRGGAYLYSGAGASLLYRIDGSAYRDQFGSSVNEAGDVNADGTPDILVGADQLVCCRSGYVEVRSGVDGSLIHHVAGKNPRERADTGWALGDVNGDGFDDFAVRAPGLLQASGAFGEVRIYSGGDGREVTTLIPALGENGYGWSIANLGDLNLDGASDLAIGIPGAAVGGVSDAGAANVLSGACFDIRRYCDAGVNSTGKRARMALVGTTSITDDDLALSASGLPPGKPGLFVFGTAQIQVPFGDGFRCVGGSTFRPGPFVHASAGGRVERDFDFGTSPVTAGSAWNFQLWYRDSTAAGFNLSDALTVGFCP